MAINLERAARLTRRLIAAGIGKETAARTVVKSMLETAAPKGAWFTSMSKVAQQKYLKNHPSTKSGVAKMEQHDKYAAWHSGKADAANRKKGLDKNPVAAGHAVQALRHGEAAHKMRKSMAVKYTVRHGNYGTAHEDTKHKGDYDAHYKGQNAHDEASDAFASINDTDFTKDTPRASRHQWDKAMQKRDKAFEATNKTSLKGNVAKWKKAI